MTPVATTRRHSLVGYNFAMMRFTSARLSTGLLWVLLAACPRTAPVPHVPAPAVVERVDAELPLPESKLRLRVQADLTSFEALLAAQLNQRLALKQNDWTRVTAQGASPEVETRMQARIDPPRMRMQRGQLEVDVPIAYWGKVRAQAKTPFGTLWLSRGLDWGTEKAPGRITLSLRVAPTLQDNWQLSTRSSLVDVELVAPPGDALCGKLVIKVCVPRETAAAQVHAELDKQIRASARGLLSGVDQQIAREARLSQLIEFGLASLRSETAVSQGVWLAIEPTAIAAGAFEGAGSSVELPLDLTFRPSFRSVSAGAVPAKRLKRSDLGKAASAFHLDLSVPFTTLAEELSRACATIKNRDFRVRSVQVLGSSNQATDRLVLALTLARESDELTVYATALPTLEAAQLTLQDLRFTPESERALDVGGLDKARLLTDVQQVSHLALDAALSRQVQLLEGKLALPFALFGRFALSVDGARFEGLRFTRAGLLVRSRGKANARLKP